MSLSRPLRILVAVFAVLLMVSLIGCKTTPEPEPEEAPVIEEPAVTPEPETPVVEPEVKEVAPLSAVDVEAARAAVRRANLMGANTYFPTEYRKLVEDLNSGIALGGSDPDAARSALLMVIKNANALYDRTLMARAKEYEDKYYRADAALMKINADKFAPKEYKNTQALAMETLALYNSGDLAAAQAKADATLAAQSRLYYNLSENIRYVGILRRDTENYLSDAEDNDAYIYSPVELEAANRYYIDGISAYRSYDLFGSVKLLTEAKRQSVLAARTSAVRKRQSETDSLMTQTQNRLEAASQLRVLDAEGTVQEARPWGGNDYLSRNPLIDHSKNVGPVDIEDPTLKGLDEPVDNEAEGIPADIPITDSDTLVNADEQVADYLAFAQTLWEKGVTARNAGQFDLAQDYFRQAQAYIDVYESNAVSQVYTVVFRQVATDCLWRIAEMDQIFANPFLWPKIWRANRRIVQNPDLIYPGQILVIPPK